MGSPLGHEESDTTEHTHTYTHIYTHRLCCQTRNSYCKGITDFNFPVFLSGILTL